MSISSVFPSAQQLLFTLQHEVTQYESNTDRSPALSSSIQSHFDTLLRSLVDLESLVAMEGAARREMWRSRVRQMTEECNLLRSSFTRTQQSVQRRQHEEAIRRDLLEGGTRRRGDVSAIDTLSRENDSLLNSNRLLDEFTAMGQSALDSLHRQRSNLKGIQRKVLDLGNSVGMSSSLLRLIERTETFNACLVAAGMVVTCSVVGFVYYYYVRNK